DAASPWGLRRLSCDRDYGQATDRERYDAEGLVKPDPCRHLAPPETMRRSSGRDRTGTKRDVELGSGSISPRLARRRGRYQARGALSTFPKGRRRKSALIQESPTHAQRSRDSNPVLHPKTARQRALSQQH